MANPKPYIRLDKNNAAMLLVDPSNRTALIGARLRTAPRLAQ